MTVQNSYLLDAHCLSESLQKKLTSSREIQVFPILLHTDGRTFRIIEDQSISLDIAPTIRKTEQKSFNLFSLLVFIY